jgi:methyl-accepting chemotaxis protein
MMNSQKIEQASNMEDRVTTIGIVGGGKVGLTLLNLFLQSDLTRVAYVVDKDPEAPAVKAALKNEVATFLDLSEAIHKQTVDFVFEVTGSNRVVEIIRQLLGDSTTKLITHEMAHILMSVIEENRQKTNVRVQTEILSIQTNITESLKSMESTLASIKQTTSDMHYLALNARIEAARAGEHGKGFDIVAQQVERSALTVRELTQEIDRVRTDISGVSAQIEASLKNLQ